MGSKIIKTDDEILTNDFIAGCNLTMKKSLNYDQIYLLVSLLGAVGNAFSKSNLDEVKQMAMFNQSFTLMYYKQENQISLFETLYS